MVFLKPILSMEGRVDKRIMDQLSFLPVEDKHSQAEKKVKAVNLYTADILPISSHIQKKIEQKQEEKQIILHQGILNRIKHLIESY